MNVAESKTSEIIHGFPLQEVYKKTQDSPVTH